MCAPVLRASTSIRLSLRSSRSGLPGDYDPHPAEGVEQPLAAVLTDFRFILLRNWGHLPWLERETRDKFYEILTAELRSAQ